MANGKMIDIMDLALGANNANNVLTMPSFASIQQRNRDARRQSALEDLSRRNQEYYDNDRSWDKYEAQMDMGGYRPSVMNGYKPSYADMDDSVFTPNEEAMNPTYENLGGMGGNMREPTSLVTANTSPNNVGQDQDTEATKTKFEDEVSKVFSIQGLLQKLKELGSLQPGDNREGLFQLDTIYKGSSPMEGIPGTPAEYPAPQGKAMMGFNLGNMRGNE